MIALLVRSFLSPLTQAINRVNHLLVIHKGRLFVRKPSAHVEHYSTNLETDFSSTQNPAKSPVHSPSW